MSTTRTALPVNSRIVTRLLRVGDQLQLVVVGLVGVPITQAQRVEQAEVCVPAERFQLHDVRPSSRRLER